MLGKEDRFTKWISGEATKGLAPLETGMAQFEVEK
jgi:hypothetical protein